MRAFHEIRDTGGSSGKAYRGADPGGTASAHEATTPRHLTREAQASPKDRGERAATGVRVRAPRNTPVSDGLVVGIDCATRTVRAICVDASGGVLAQAARELPAPVRSAPGHSEQDARAWWPAVAATLRELTALLGSDARRIVALAPATTSGTIVLADGDGEPLGPALLYDDVRAHNEAERAQRLGAERWERAGLQIGSSFALAKLAWLAGRPQGLEGAAHAWSTADLIVARLLGRPGPSDWSHALKTGYDPLERSWAHDVLEALGIPSTLLPEVERPTHLAGELSADAAGLIVVFAND